MSKDNKLYNTIKQYKDYYVVLQKGLLYASHTLNKDTGELLPFTDKAKLVYLHMLNQYKGFKSIGKPYYETRKTIGDHMGVSEKQIRRSIIQLTNIGLIVTKRTAFNQYNTEVLELSILKGRIDLVNTKLITPEKVIDSVKHKITSEEYLNTLDNKKRWDVIESALMEEKQKPFINHRKNKLNNLTASIIEYKEFLKWKELQK